jgi:hypothetical protein
MSSATVQLDALIDQYLAGDQDSQEFWRLFMYTYADANLSAQEEAAYEDAYETVYMGSSGAVAKRDKAVGLLAEKEVKARLRAFRTRRSGAVNGRGDR